MNFAAEEPRKVPKPMPFSESSLHPTVPEVSLILQETQAPSPTQSNSSLSGTEFQSYNAWRWKNLNEREKENLQKQKITKKKNEFHPINDKFSGSSIERRKNEILYGNMDEPRRPLPPRQIPVIPKFIGASFSDASFSNEHWATDESKDENILKGKIIYPNGNNINHHKCDKQESSPSWLGDPNDIRDFYQIISQQNTHMVQLQKQIEQLLKSQDVKEKQIEQLLKSQEAKETKIEQLLKMQDAKQNHIEQLLKTQEKQEKQIEQLILSQEKKEKQIHEISKQFMKEFKTVAVMTEASVADKSVNTDLQCFCKGVCNKGITNGNVHRATMEESSTECNRFGSGDQSFTLHSLNLPTIQEQAPTPQSSIHVDLPEYNGSSDDDSDSSGSERKDTLINRMSNLKPSGYTFYNNVLTQVNDIIHNQDDKENEGPNTQGGVMDFGRSKIHQCGYLKESDEGLVKPVNDDRNVDHLWGLTDFQPEHGLPSNSLKGINFGKETESPSDISLRMNALALKYLKQEQISQYQMQSQLLRTNRQPDVTIYNVTNLSFGTMRYLERHKISVGESRAARDTSYSPHKFLQHKTAPLRGKKGGNLREEGEY